jgi:hypothetical protein
MRVANPGLLWESTIDSVERGYALQRLYDVVSGAKRDLWR